MTSNKEIGLEQSCRMHYHSGQYPCKYSMYLQSRRVPSRGGRRIERYLRHPIVTACPREAASISVIYSKSNVQVEFTIMPASWPPFAGRLAGRNDEVSK